MFSPMSRFCMFLLVLPMAASADPVTVTTHSSGSVDPNPLVLDRLGLDAPDGPLPYDLTISSIFDPDQPGYFDHGKSVSAFGTEVSISLEIGTMTYHYAGQGWTGVDAWTGISGLDDYQHEITFIPPESPSYSVSVWNRMTGPVGSLTAVPPLAPRSFGLGPGQKGAMEFTAYPNNPDAPGHWLMFASAGTLSLQVVSGVPEPSSSGMLLAGLLVLGLPLHLRSRRRRVRPTS